MMKAASTVQPSPSVQHVQSNTYVEVKAKVGKYLDLDFDFDMNIKIGLSPSMPPSGPIQSGLGVLMKIPNDQADPLQATRPELGTGTTPSLPPSETLPSGLEVSAPMSFQFGQPSPAKMPNPTPISFEFGQPSFTGTPNPPPMNFKFDQAPPTAWPNSTPSGVPTGCRLSVRTNRPGEP